MLYVDAAGRIHRRLSFAEVRGGRALPLPAVDPMGNGPLDNPSPNITRDGGL
jgi:hypothetical protein